MNAGQESVLDRVRRALGRSHTTAPSVAPPALPEPLVRLVHSDIGLQELFVKRATEMGTQAQLVTADELAPALLAFFRDNRVKRLAVGTSPLFSRLGVTDALKEVAAEVSAIDWSTCDPAALYDCDAGLTDVTWAVAETGSLVINTHRGNGRALSLVPKLHIAVVEPRQLLPDLVDLFEKLAKAPSERRSYTLLISGPSKTADIEMNVVTGVHGPTLVKVFVLN